MYTQDTSTLCTMYTRLVYKVLHNYGCGNDEDAAQVGYMGLLEANTKYLDNKGCSFLTYAYIVISRRVLDYLKKEARYYRYNTPSDTLQATQYSMDYNSWEFGEHLTEEQVQLVTLLMEGYSLKECSEVICCSYKQTRTILYKLRDTIRQEMENTLN